MLVKLLAAVLAAVSLSLVGVYLASEGGAPIPFASAVSGTDDLSAPSCCGTPSRASCCVEVSACELDAVTVAPEPLAACVGTFAVAHRTVEPTEEVNVTNVD